jgi:hypothetical protein
MFNYGEALEKAIMFYEAQRSGRLPANPRVPWRKDSALNDGRDANVDLTGGWYDAGDYMKYGFPFASSVTMLAWGAIEYRAGFVASGQLPYIEDNLKWAADYLLKAYRPDSSNDVKNDVFYGQVGKTESDHDWWGPPENMTMARPSFKITKNCPGSDLAAESAAAMAAVSIVLRVGGNNVYANSLLALAERLYKFGDKYRGKYSECITDAKDSYESSGFKDELVWGALWLHKAKLAQGLAYNGSYLETAERYYTAFNLGGSDGWTHNWDDKIYGAYILLAQLTGKNVYKADAEGFLDWWMPGGGVPYTRGGLACLVESNGEGWGTLRYSANTSLLAFIYSDWLIRSAGNIAKAASYHNFAVKQINYILGDNPRRSSYMVGFGNNPPKRPHHASSHYSLNNKLEDPVEQKYVLYGAMVGGPEAVDDFAVHLDQRSNYISNEVACDYNAGLTGALARMCLEPQ